MTAGVVRTTINVARDPVGTPARAVKRAVKRVFKEWLHPRGKDGMFIAKGGMVNVDQPGGKKRRAKVLNLTEKGPEIQYQDQGKEKATIPLAKVVDTVSQAADSKARLDDEVK